MQEQSTRVASHELRAGEEFAGHRIESVLGRGGMGVVYRAVDLRLNRPAALKVITAAGVSAGIDMALTLAERLAGPEVAQAVQLGIEYDPQPPFDAGSPDKAPAEIVEVVRAIERAEEAELA